MASNLPETVPGTAVARAANATNALAKANNFKVIGIGVGSSTSKLSDFAKRENLSFPVIDDSDGEITKQLRLSAPLALLGVDPEAYVTFAVPNFPADGDIEGFARGSVR